MPTSVLPFDLFVFVFFPTPVFLYKHAFLFHILSSTLTSMIVDIQLQSPTLRVAVLADSIDSLDPSQSKTKANALKAIIIHTSSPTVPLFRGTVPIFGSKFTFLTVFSAH